MDYLIAYLTLAGCAAYAYALVGFINLRYRKAGGLHFVSMGRVGGSFYLRRGGVK